MFPHRINILPLNIIKEIAKDYVVGQDNLIDEIAVLLYKHLLKVIGLNTGKLAGSQTNTLILGGTGTGKTHSIRQMASLIGIPFVEINAMTLGIGGSWAGSDITKTIQTAFSYSDIESYESRNYPIILIDEIDKICNLDSQGHNLSIQYSLLKIVEGNEIILNRVKYNTRNFCFIFAGAFSDMMKESNRSIGFFQSKDNDVQVDFYQKLTDAGMIPELVGRINKIVKTMDFTVEMYYKLLYNPNTTFNKFINYLKEILGTEFKDLSAPLIVDKAMRKNIGARGLVQAVEEYIDAFLLENSNKIDINKLWEDQFPIYKRAKKEEDEL